MQESAGVVGTKAGVEALRDNSVETSAEEAAPTPLVAPGPRRSVHFLIESAMVLGVWLVGASFFFRAEWSDHFRTGMGDNFDSVHLTYFQEHWYQVLLGHSSWRSPEMFYPLKGALGWSDALVLFELFYTPLRLLGADMFLAAQLTIILLSLVGFASFVCLARVAFGVQRGIALLGGLAFTFANNIWLHLYWFQLLTVWLVPGIALLGVLALRGLSEHRARSLVLGAAFGLSAALLFLTDVYIAWFSSIAVGTAFAILLLTRRGRLLNTMGTWLRNSWLLVVTASVAFAVGFLPFLLTYLPAQRTAHHLSYATIMLTAPHTRDLLNVGVGNVFWTSTIHRVAPAAHLRDYALTYAITPVLMTLAIVGTSVALWMWRKDRARGWPVTSRYAAVLAATAVVLCILPIRTSYGSLWAVIWHIPGATAIRRTNRLGVVTGLVASLAAVCAASAIYTARGRQPYKFLRRAAIIVVLLLAVVEQVNTTPMNSLNRSAHLAFLRSATAPLPGCRSFYVLDRTQTILPPPGLARHKLDLIDQLDAMLISQKYAIPTLNGYTSYDPSAWDLAEPFSPSYLTRVGSWVRAHNLEHGLCQLDLGTMRWQREAEPPVANEAKRTG